MTSEPRGAASDGSPSATPKPGDRIGPYEVIRLIARGGMAEVLEVRDVRDGAVRALKLLLPLPHIEEARSRFRREFRALSRLDHPSVLRVFEWGVHGDRPWFSMERVHGRELRDAVAEWRDLDPADRLARCHQVLVDIARALAYIHDRGLVHRDVTPANIMVQPDGSAKLMDFGVVKELGADLTQAGSVVGTVAYIAPEQIVGDSVDARADLYSLGAVLYLMLTGRRPFHARTLQGFLEKHLHEAPRPPSEIDPLVPALLDGITMRLLEKERTERYASAHHLLHVLGDTDPHGNQTEHWPPRTVGRTLLKARIQEAIEDIATGHAGTLMVLRGSGGLGKSRLLDVAEDAAHRLGVAVARGRCRRLDRPFGPFVQVFQDLASPGSAPLLREALLGDDTVLPSRYAVLSAFRDLVVAHKPCVVLLDDLHAADPATVDLMEYLVRNTLGLASEPIVFVATEEAGPTESDTDRRLKLAGPLQPIPILPLEQSEVEELVLSLLPNEPASLVLAQRLHAETDGSPAFIADMLRGLVDEGLLVRRDGGGFRLAVDAAAITESRLPIPASLRQALEERLAPLDADQRAVGRALAIARRPIGLDILHAVCPLPEDRLIDALDALVGADIVEETREEIERFELSHNRFRDVLADDMSPAARMLAHRVLGEVLERTYRQRPLAVVEDLAYHFEKAGVATKAYAYLALTAGRHLSRSLYDEALTFLDRALRIESNARPYLLLAEADRQLADVHLARSQALYHRGEWDRALEAVREAEALSELVREPRLASRIAAELGDQLRNRGAVDEAEKQLRRALAAARSTGDLALTPMPLYALGGLMLARGELDEAELSWKESLATAQRIGDDRASGFGLNGLGILEVCRGRSMEARRHLEQSADLFERLGLLAPLAIARVNLVELYLSTGVLRKALQLADRTVAQAREVHHPHGIALGLAYRAQVLLELGRTEEAALNAREALRIDRDLGTTEDEIVALGCLVRVAIAHDDGEAAFDALDELAPLVSAHDVDGIAAQVHAWTAHAHALLGDTDDAHAELRRLEGVQRQWPLVQVRLQLAVAGALAALDDTDKARAALQRALTIAEATGYRYYQLVAHDGLGRVVAADTDRARHQRVARALGKSLAAGLPREDGERFLARRWGDA